MSNITVCDKCGVHLTFPSEIYNFRATHEKAVITFDLCKDCHYALLEWVKSKDKENEPEKLDTPTIKQEESKPANELVTPVDAPDYYDCKRMEYNGYSSHDAESHYKCPSCNADYGSWSFLHMKMYNTKGGKIFQCTKCKTWLRCPE